MRPETLPSDIVKDATLSFFSAILSWWPFSSLVLPRDYELASCLHSRQEEGGSKRPPFSKKAESLQKVYWAQNASHSTLKWITNQGTRGPWWLYVSEFIPDRRRSKVNSSEDWYESPQPLEQIVAPLEKRRGQEINFVHTLMSLPQYPHSTAASRLCPQLAKPLGAHGQTSIASCIENVQWAPILDLLILLYNLFCDWLGRLLAVLILNVCIMPGLLYCHKQVLMYRNKSMEITWG